MAISVSNWVWDHSRTRHGARLVLLAIADCAREDGSAWPSVPELKRKTGLGERAVQAAIIDCAKLGELEVGYQAGPKGCNRYRVLMPATPADIAGVPQILRGADPAGAQTLRGSASPQVSDQDPADIAPPANIAPPQISTPDPAISAGGTVKEPPQNSSTKSSGRAKPQRGTRLTADFTITTAMVAWARRECPHVDGKRETEKFINYWTAKTGQAATKLDWPATWRNWMLTAGERSGPAANGQSPLPGVSPRDEHRYRR